MLEPRFKRDPHETWWIHHGRCVGEDPELFFPIGSSGPAVAQTERAIEVCRSCPVREDCLEWALETCQDDGVWGGMGEEDRRAIRRERRRIAASTLQDEDAAGTELIGVG